MTVEELDDIILYNGQIRAMRKVCIEYKLVSVEELALMDTHDVSKVIAKHFEMLGVCNGGETIFLVEKDKWDDVLKYIVPLYR